MRLLFAPALCLLVAAAEAKPPVFPGGTPGPAGAGPSSACGTGTVCADFKDGQTRVTWTDPHTGASGANFRARVYRSTSPIDAGNYASLPADSLIASYILNNSGQLLGGNPDSASGTAFSAAGRQSASEEMSVLTDLGTPLAAYTGLQVYTALATENAYYAVVETDTSNASPTFVGSVGPIGESVATPQPVKGRDSLTRSVGGSYGKILTPSGKDLVFTLHASNNGTGGTTKYSNWGDFWEWWLTAAQEGINDGRPEILTVLQDTASGHFPSLSTALQATYLDTLWNTLGTGGIELSHFGAGVTPNPLVGVANKLYPFNKNALKRLIQWTISHYGTDPNKTHITGHSMGAWGGATTGLKLNADVPLASMWLEYPLWRYYERSASSWPGITWTTSPFQATVAAAPNTLGTTATSVQLPDGTVWGGTGNYADMPAFIAANPGTDLPFVAWSIGRGDQYPASGNYIAGFKQQIDAAAAFDSANRGYAFCWATMGHELTSYPAATIDRDAAGALTAVAYRKDKFAINLPYIAFANSSINDNPGTGSNTGSGLSDGDFQGCLNAGFTWNVTSDTSGAFNFTVGNGYMGLSPTHVPTTTTTATISSASGSGSVTVADTSDWTNPTTSNHYALIGDDASPSTQEIVTLSAASGGTVSFTSARGQFGTTAQTHASGVTIRQMIGTPTGPNGGPYTTMTADVAIRRAQGGLVPSDCAVTPDGGATTHFTVGSGLSFNDGIPVLTGVTINSSGVTSIACS